MTDGFYTVKVGNRQDVFFNDTLLISDVTVEQAQELIASLDYIFGEDYLEDLEFSLEEEHENSVLDGD